MKTYSTIAKLKPDSLIITILDQDIPEPIRTSLARDLWFPSDALLLNVRHELKLILRENDGK